MTTMLDKCAVAGDITQAIDRRGAWAVAITVIGGTESTAVKLQSCETADGSFTDFKTLIASADASAEQYKGFVVDLHGAKQFIKVVGATMATGVLGDCDHDLKSVAIKAGEVPSGADLDNNVEETINVSTYSDPVEILPTEGKDGMKKATVALSNVPQIESNKAQSIDVSQYTEAVEIEPTSPNDAMAKVTVTLSNIPSGGGTAYAWEGNDSRTPQSPFFNYFNASVAPVDASNLQALQGTIEDGLSVTNATAEGDTYTKISDTSFSISWVDDGDTVTQTFTRDATKDFTLW